jgi:hypothetical protein
MLTASVITLFAGAVQGATTLERMRGMRSLNSSHTANMNVLHLVGIAAIVILTIMLFAVRKMASRKLNSKKADQFNEHADRYGLTEVERRLIMTIARFSEIRDATLIFSTQDAFYRGASRLMQERFTAGDSIDDRRHLKQAVELIHRKLGFAASTESRVSTPLGLTTRQIPVGRQVDIIGGAGGVSGQIEASVTANTDDGLVLKLPPGAKVSTTVGDVLRIRYNFNTSTWEFDSPIIALAENAVTLSPCDLVRFTNRRRFMRVPAKGKAMVANYTFQPKDASLSAAMPTFVPAEITEIAGPGFRIETSLNTAIGERLLIIVRFENNEVVRDMAEVKHLQPSTKGFSIALELVTLNDNEVGQEPRIQPARRRRPRLVWC